MNRNTFIHFMMLIILGLYINLSIAEMICKDTETNMEYIANDDLDHDFEMKALSNRFNVLTSNIKSLLDMSDNYYLSKQKNFVIDDENNNVINNDNNITNSLSEKLNAFNNRLDKINAYFNKILDSDTTTAISVQPTNCMEAMNKKHLIYKIKLPSSINEETCSYTWVPCEENAYHGTGWMVIMRRIDGSVDFYRNWTEYKNGFGDLHAEFFIGLEKLHAMTSNGIKQELLVVLKNANGVTKFANYDSFVIGNEYEGYALKELGRYRGNAGNALFVQLHQKFSTRDVDNTQFRNKLNCGDVNKSAWWFRNCLGSHLTGPYWSENARRSIKWLGFAVRNIKFAEMLIRPKY